MLSYDLAIHDMIVVNTMYIQRGWAELHPEQIVMTSNAVSNLHVPPSSVAVPCLVCEYRLDHVLNLLVVSCCSSNHSPM